MEGLTMHNIGATQTVVANDDGTYSVITQGSKKGAQPTVAQLTQEELQELFGKNLKPLDTDVAEFGKKGKNVLDTISDFNCLVNPAFAVQKYAIDQIKDGLTSDNSEQQKGLSFKDVIKTFAIISNPVLAQIHYLKEIFGKEEV